MKKTTLWITALLMILILAIGPAEEAVSFAPVEEVEEWAFAVPEEEERVWTAEEAEPSPFVVEDGVLTACLGGDESVRVPEGVVKIGEHAFAGCTSLRQITLPGSTVEIGAHAFAGCASLESVIAPGVRKVGSGAFAGCAALRETVFAEDAEIAPDAFTMPEPEAEVPVITSQPSSKKIKAGGEVFFSVSAIRADNYQWQYLSGSTWKDIYNGGAYTGPYTGTLRFTAKATLDGIQYRCRIWNDRGTAYSNVVTFSILNAPVVTSQPSSKKIAAGGEVFFNVKATDAAKYRWQYSVGSGWSDLYNDSTYSGVTTSTLRFTAKATLNNRMFRCKIWNDAGCVYSNVVTFTLATAAKPVFTTQPGSKTVQAGQQVTFTGKASGDPTYRWQYYSGSGWKDLYNDSTYSGVTTTTLKFTSKSTLSGRQYRLKASNAGGTAYSNTVKFTCQAGSVPSIYGYPVDRTDKLGNTAKFSASANNYTSLRWQCDSGSGWKDIYDDATYSGTKTLTLSFTAKNTLHGRKYRLSATNAAGTVYSPAAVFRVQLPNIYGYPVDRTNSVGEKAYFLSDVSGQTSIRWQCNDGSGWKDIYDGSTYSGTTTTDLSFTAASSLSGCSYRLSASNAAGKVYSPAANFWIRLTLSQSSVILNNGATYYALNASASATWTSSNPTVASVSSNGTITANYPGTATITASNGGSKATCKVTVRAVYRALLISQKNFHKDDVPEGQGTVQYRWTTARDQWADLLSHVHGSDGGAYTVTRCVDLTSSEVYSKITSVFGSARDGDVSLIAFFTHGVESANTNRRSGALLCYNRTNVYLPDLADALDDVNGRVIVVIEACGSGAATTAFTNGTGGAGGIDAFQRDVIAAFAQADPMLAVKQFNEIGEDAMIGVPEPETNEFLTSKFVILTAARHQETQWGYESGNGGLYMTDCVLDAVGTSGGLPADSLYGNSDGKLTMRELLTYLDNTLSTEARYTTDAKGNKHGPYYQHATIYPSDGSFVLFIR